MPGGKETTTVERSPQYEQFMQQVFGAPPGSWGNLLGLQPAGVGIGNIEELFGPMQPQLTISPLQRQATNQLGQYLNQPAPEMRAYNLAMQGLSPMITGQGQWGDVATAMQPLFQRNLNEALTQLSAQAPGRFGSAFLQQGTNLGQRALQDYNLFIQQARQQDIQNRINAALGLGTLAQSAGQGPFQRMLGAGQYGLGVSQFLSQPAMMGMQNRLAMQQMILQLLGQPTGQTTTTSPGFYDWMQMGSRAAAAAMMGGGGG